MSTPYVALGDSYSAGIGSDTGGTQCGREGGYPVELARRLGLDLSYQAGSGATIDDVLGWQVAPLGSETRLVTMTIGGNDAGFAAVLIACAQPAWLDERLQDFREARPVVVREGPRRRGSGERFRLPDLLSPQSLAGVERYGLDPYEVAALARRVPSGRRRRTRRQPIRRRRTACSSCIFWSMPAATSSEPIRSDRRM